MKHRNGFVSNSSSSSFVLVGACLDSDKFREFLKKEYFLTEEFKEESWTDLSLEEMKENFGEVETAAIIEYIDDKSDIYIQNDYDYVYVGLSPSPDYSVKGETFLQQMKRSADKIQNIENIINDCKFFTDEGKKKILKNIQWHEEVVEG